MGTEPDSGRTVLVPESQAVSMGLQNIMDAPADTQNKALSARHWIPLAQATVPLQLSNPADQKSAATNADQMGILQLIDRLDQRGLLGVVSSRWNDFMTGQVGAGDPEVEALRAKMGLSNTLLMNAHVGSRGGSYMLEHFEDLANAKKMNAQTLRTGVKSELNYIQDRAMLPSNSKFGGTTSPTQPAPQPQFNWNNYPKVQVGQGR